MKNNGKKFVCANGACRFGLDFDTMRAYADQKCIHKPTINVPVCKTCSGSTISCNKNTEWASYLQPLYMCSCKIADQIKVNEKMFGDLLTGNFKIPVHVPSDASGDATTKKKNDKVFTKPGGSPLDMSINLPALKAPNKPLLPSIKIDIPKQQ